MASGAAVLHVDMEQAGWELPVMPENWKHYVGVDLWRPEKAIESLRDESNALESVALEGHKWAHEHYSPRATARRFLGFLSQ